MTPGEYFYRVSDERWLLDRFLDLLAAAMEKIPQDERPTARVILGTHDEGPGFLRIVTDKWKGY